MGMFTKDASVPTPPTSVPLDRGRIVAALDRRGMRHGVDGSGDVGGYWDGHLFYFLLLGEGDGWLRAQGRWNRQVGTDQLPALLEAVNEWNATHLWPKGYVRAEGDTVGVYAEHSVDYSRGLSDEQVDLHLVCAITTGLQLFEHLDARYPAEAAAARAALDRQRG